MKLMEQHQVSPKENPFSYLWVANCALYSAVMAFLVNKGWKKSVLEVGKKISIAEADALKKNNNNNNKNKKITIKKRKKKLGYP